jgi:hypothetical protein
LLDREGTYFLPIDNDDAYQRIVLKHRNSNE